MKYALAAAALATAATASYAPEPTYAAPENPPAYPAGGYKPAGYYSSSSSTKAPYYPEPTYKSKAPYYTSSSSTEAPYYKKPYTYYTTTTTCDYHTKTYTGKEGPYTTVESTVYTTVCPVTSTSTYSSTVTKAPYVPSTSTYVESPASSAPAAPAAPESPAKVYGSYQPQSSASGNASSPIAYSPGKGSASGIAASLFTVGAAAVAALVLA